MKTNRHRVKGVLEYMLMVNGVYIYIYIYIYFKLHEKTENYQTNQLAANNVIIPEQINSNIWKWI